jgi:hypothetical protein
VTYQDKIIYGTLATVTLLVVLLAWWGIGVRRRAESSGLTLKADEVARSAGGILISQRFIWGTWQNLLSGRTFRLHVRDERDTPLTIITKHQIPKDGVHRSFDWEGRPMACVAEGMLSNRTFLRELPSGPILLSCRHGHRRDVFYRGDSDQEICRIAYGSIFKSYRPILVDGHEIGRIGNVTGPDAMVRALSVQENRLTLLEQVFVMASL